ncbi:hypothetical protein ISN44_As04g035010 [Arabidopsis suecica]|uniref:Uncharacterized protein n=3 Tax=Arabidopsis TaxID=3701 RepID=Q1G3K4_ARATH|nr:uncharacterized protein AT4G33467 [Arabidopsis thaliana]ABF59239.1 unknown protein [Arabidopsis thaliana]AEE86230.1 hypothetical protein AT4G33467 [Arabidopsis thaliana]KAG7622734.1 hypothetical protein ISN44_As04g035010 [Arabidopsis suecica]|eukprot:NP_001078486.1 hypothetical protein AT4G33467 [Arabidopsis thaliana]
MEVSKRMDMLERRSSIETEPMTLHLDQLENAREEALYVMKTKTMEEAMDIFTKETHEGLRASEERGGRCINLKDEEDDDDYEDERMMFMSPHAWDIHTAPF